MKKYKLTNIRCPYDEKLYKIKALRDFGTVKKGELGGYVESEKNLSHEGNCWIFDNAKVHDNAKIYMDAKIYDDVKIYGNSEIFGYAAIFGFSQIDGYTKISGHSEIADNTIIRGNNVEIKENARVYGSPQICGTNISIIGSVKVHDKAVIHGSDISIFDNGNIYGNSKIHSNVVISGKTEIFHQATIHELSDIYNGYIKNTSDVLVIGPIGSRDDYTTFYRGKRNIQVITGCFHGTLTTFEKEVRKHHQNCPDIMKRYLCTINYIREYFNIR